MSIKKIIGYSLLASPFVGLIRVTIYEIGIANTLLILALIAVLLAVIVAGCYLIQEKE
jgi:hypothetical protein